MKRPVERLRRRLAPLAPSHLDKVTGGNRTGGDHDIIIDPDDDLMPPARPA